MIGTLWRSLAMGISHAVRSKYKREEIDVENDIQSLQRDAEKEDAAVFWDRVRWRLRVRHRIGVHEGTDLAKQHFRPILEELSERQS